MRRLIRTLRPGGARGIKRNPDAARAKTVAVKNIRRDDLRAGALMNPPVAGVERPRTRGDCLAGGINCERPCPFVACKHHLYLDVNPESGSITIRFPDLEPWELRETCSLDVADRGGSTLEEVGELTNLTRERIRQVEVRGLFSIRRHPSSAALGT